MEQWCDSCGKMTNWINGECENYQPIKTSNSTSMETSPSKAPLTWEQAKDQVASNHLVDDWDTFGYIYSEDYEVIHNALTEAAELYATSRVQALEEENKKLKFECDSNVAITGALNQTIEERDEKIEDLTILYNDAKSFLEKERSAQNDAVSFANWLATHEIKSLATQGEEWYGPDLVVKKTNQLFEEYNSLKNDNRK